MSARVKYFICYMPAQLIMCACFKNIRVMSACPQILYPITSDCCSSVDFDWNSWINGRPLPKCYTSRTLIVFFQMRGRARGADPKGSAASALAEAL
jgi:hypothetical protein